MTEYRMIEKISVINNGDKASFVIRKLQRYIRNIRSPLVFNRISIDKCEMLINNQVFSLSDLAFNNSSETDKKPWVLADAFSRPPVLETEKYIITAPDSPLDSEGVNASGIVTFSISCLCDIAAGSEVGYRYWKEFFDAFDCDELREAVTYKNLIVKEGAEDNHYNYWFGRVFDSSDQYVMYVYDSAHKGFMKPVECNYIPDSEENWELSEINFDDYNDIYTWLALSEEEWSQKALDKCEPLFKRIGAELERYSELPGEDDESDCKYIWQGLNIFSGKIKGDDVNDFIDCYDSLIKCLRSMSNGKKKPDGNSFRYLIGEGKESIAIIILDDSDPDYNGVKVRCARI